MKSEKKKFRILKKSPIIIHFLKSQISEKILEYLEKCQTIFLQSDFSITKWIVRKKCQIQNKSEFWDRKVRNMFSCQSCHINWEPWTGSCYHTGNSPSWSLRCCGLAGQSACLVNRRSCVQLPAVPLPDFLKIIKYSEFWKIMRRKSLNEK